tara:strand:+ start:961 stop:1881 length:921 start_codon:yes stop_codon:yes gene_type:complete
MSKKIVFMGTPEFAVPTLEALKNSKNEILAVYSQPASRANRGQKLFDSKIGSLAKKLSLNLRTPKTLDNDTEYKFFNSLKPDIGVVVAYGQIIPKKFLSIPKFGFINVHASLLPKWRGAAPIQRSIMNLDKETGVSIMKIVEKLDSGPVLHQDKIKLNENIDSLTLSKLLSQLGAKSLMNAIEKIENNNANFIEQNHDQATYAKKITKNESEIIWDQNANLILAKINGLNPNPGAWFKYKNERYKVWKAKISNESGLQGSTIDNNLTIACKDKSINILEIQKEGKSRQATNQFLLGSKIPKGEKIA